MMNLKQAAALTRCPWCAGSLAVERLSKTAWRPSGLLSWKCETVGCDFHREQLDRKHYVERLREQPDALYALYSQWNKDYHVTTRSEEGAARYQLVFDSKGRTFTQMHGTMEELRRLVVIEKEAKRIACASANKGKR